jgi:nicotinamidase-related amidase
MMASILENFAFVVVDIQNDYCHRQSLRRVMQTGTLDDRMEVMSVISSSLP